MALQLDIENLIPGYFVSSSFEEISYYVVSLIRSINRSFIFQVHSSGLFTRDGDEQEIHLPIIPSVVLDPQMPDELLYEILAEKYYYCLETEFFDNIDGSGWNFIPGTLRFWFKIYPCQPNAPALENRDNHGDAPNDDDMAANPALRDRNWFLYAIMEYFAREANIKIPKQRFLRMERLEEFKRKMGVQIPDDHFTKRVNLQDLAEYHTSLGALNIRVFSMRGNLLYAKKLAPDPTVEFIDLYLNSSNQFALILNLWTFFQKKRRNSFCMYCIKWVTGDHHCEQQKLTAKKEDVRVPDIPYGRHGLVVYADFESYIDPRGDIHNISGYGWVAIGLEHNVIKHNVCTVLDVEDVINQFLTELIELAGQYAIEHIIETRVCQICNLDIYPGSPTVEGRNFINGKTGSHHPECWDLRQNTMYVFFHNFRGYDSHFIIKRIVSKLPVLNLSATSMEKFNLIQIADPNNELVRFTFKDTFNFFTCSLAKCVSMIEDWRYSPMEVRNKKGIFPYDWFTGPEKLLEKALPPSPWHNKLTKQTIDASEAFQAWEEQHMETFEDFHNFYMMTDVLQLCDAFEEFRRTCILEFNTDPVHFQGAPGFTWYLGLCQNPELFKIIQDREIYLDIQNGIRGGVSQAMMRYVNVEDKPDESMFFLDVNSLYSKCMTYKLPGQYIETCYELPLEWNELWCQESPYTAILVVDLVYPEHLHDRDWAYPLAPHKFNDRLCTTFRRKEKYMVHAEALLFYLQRGLVLEKFHYGYVFRHDYVLRDYVQGNIEKRRATKSEVMKTLYKLLNNSIYGKTCENVNKYRKFEVIDYDTLYGDEDPMTPCNGELANCKSFLQCEDKFLCEKELKEVRLDKPIQIGFAVLEFAKLEIYKFLAITSDWFGDAVTPCYTDTDSILFWCKFSKPWLHFYNSPLKEILDFEKAPPHWEIKTFDTDKQSGFWAPEAGGKEIVEYCGLRAKCYCYRFRDNEIVIKNKGIPKTAMIANEDETPREEITMEHYRNALFKGEPYHVCQYQIRSNQHEVRTKLQYKLGLSANDLKRAVTSDRAISLPFGYKGEKFKHLTTDADDPDYLDP